MTTPCATCSLQTRSAGGPEVCRPEGGVPGRHCSGGCEALRRRSGWLQGVLSDLCTAALQQLVRSGRARASDPSWPLWWWG